jgi:cell division protein FtsL
MSNWVRHALDRTSWQPQRQAAWLLILGVIMILIFGGISLSQIANYVTTNREIEDLIEQRNRLERDNERLRAEIANLQTVPRLLERAEALGFRFATANDIEYIPVDGYNPNRLETVVELASVEEFDNTPLYDATFSGWVQQQWANLINQFRAFGR